MRKILFFLYFIVSVSAVSLDELQDLMMNKQYNVHGIFYKYDFANVTDTWDFVYVANNVYYQLKGVQATNANVFGWKTLDALSVSNPSFYFVYLGDVDKNNDTKYNWVAISKTSSTINKLIGSTSSGFFSWSPNLSKLSFSFSADNKKVTFSKAIAVGSSLSDAKLPKFPDLPDRLLDVNDSDVGKGDESKDDDKTGTGSKNDDVKTDNNTSKNGNKDTGSDNKGSEDNTTKYVNNPDCTSYVKKDPTNDSPPAPGVCFEEDRKEI